MIRTSIIPTKSSFGLTLDFPKDYVGEEIEIIAFKKKEALSDEKGKGLEKVFTVLQVNTPTSYKFNLEEANEG